MIFAIGITLVFGPFVMLLATFIVAMYVDLIHNKQWVGVAFSTSVLIGLLFIIAGTFIS